MDGLAGVTAIESKTGALTVSVAVLLITSPEIAEIVVWPVARELTSPVRSI